MKKSARHPRQKPRSSAALAADIAADLMLADLLEIGDNERRFSAVIDALEVEFQHHHEGEFPTPEARSAAMTRFVKSLSQPQRRQYNDVETAHGLDVLTHSNAGYLVGLAVGRGGAR